MSTAQIRLLQYLFNASEPTPIDDARKRCRVSYSTVATLRLKGLIREWREMVPGGMNGHFLTLTGDGRAVALEAGGEGLDLRGWRASDV